MCIIEYFEEINWATLKTAHTAFDLTQHQGQSAVFISVLKPLIIHMSVPFLSHITPLIEAHIVHLNYQINNMCLQEENMQSHTI